MENPSPIHVGKCPFTKKQRNGNGKESTSHRNITNKRNLEFIQITRMGGIKKLIYSYHNPRHNLIITTSSALILQDNEKTNLIEYFVEIDLTRARDTIEEVVCTLQVDIFLSMDNLV